MNSIRLFLRPKRTGAFSIEKLFYTLLPYLQREINANIYTFRTENSGLLKRLCLLIETRRNRSLILNHITGDVNFIALVLKGKNTILTVHDLESFVRKNKFQNSLIRFFWLNLPLNKVKIITVISESTKRKLLEEFPSLSESKVKVIPNCLTSNLKIPLKEFNRNKPIILQIGTKSNKNLPNLIKAIKSVNCTLFIVGEIEKNIKSLLLIHNIDYKVFTEINDTELDSLYTQCDIVTLISTYEGFGLPILEANAAGKPVVTSSISSMPEVAGDAAILVDPNNIDDIRLGITSIINDSNLRTDLIEKGQRNIIRFSPEIIAQKYVNLYYDVLKSSNEA